MDEPCAHETRMEMSCLRSAWLSAFAVSAGGLLFTLPARADGLHALEVLREGGCGGTLPAAPALRHDTTLDHAAQQWAQGLSLDTATERSGYHAKETAAVHVTGPDATLIESLKQSGCRRLTDRSLRDAGEYTRGRDTWLIMAAPYVAPSPSQAQGLALRVLDLVNQARARPTHCGARAFAPTLPVSLSDTLSSVALGHAVDMAQHDYFEHRDLAGNSPADRVRAVGYQESLVGENIAYGPETADEVVRGWLDSPGHCENIMNPRFEEMGIASSQGRSAKHGVYWVQVLAAPRVGRI
jgi:uncharacterized protein YkwD